MEDIAVQTNNALNFVKKLYVEISYLIKEVEMLLLEEDERFIILKTGGYSITARTSTSLESYGVDMWMPKEMSVFFSPEEFIDDSKGQTSTIINPNLKILFIRLNLIDSDIDQPKIYLGYITKIKSIKGDIKKVEHMIWEFSYNVNKIFTQPGIIKYEDSRFYFEGKYIMKNLLSINSSEDVKKKIIDPLLLMYREKDKSFKG